MTGIFLQARIASNRLPNKALLPLGDMTIIDHSLRSLIKVKADFHLLLTDSDSSHALRPHAERWGFQVFIGDREDVLLRFRQAITATKVDRVVRATGDNPLVSSDLVEANLDSSFSSDVDYCALQGAPLGTGVEVVKSSALLEADRMAVSTYHREHVCPYIYDHPERFSINLSRVKSEWQGDFRVTVDTLDDYYGIETLFRSLYRGDTIPLESIITWSRGGVVCG